MINTDASLLDRIKLMDEHQAWQEFYDSYWAVILRYARKLGLSDTQSQDVLQETMVALMRTLPKFNYDTTRGRFRNFLLTIVHRQSLAAMRRAKRDTNEPWDDYKHGKHRSEPPFEAKSEQLAVERWRQSVAQEVLQELRSDPTLEPRTWRVFKTYVLEGQSASKVASEFELNTNTVYQIKNRLLRRLQKLTQQRLRDSGMEMA